MERVQVIWVTVHTSRQTLKPHNDPLSVPYLIYKDVGMYNIHIKNNGTALVSVAKDKAMVHFCMLSRLSIMYV